MIPKQFVMMALQGISSMFYFAKLRIFSAYYIRTAGEDSLSKNLWLFYLQGGGQCFSQESCASRNKSSPNLMSSKYFTESISLDGIFSADPTQSGLHSANKVFVPYCTSDGWIGDSDVTELTWGWTFYGQRVVKSALNDLIDTNLITSSSQILFAGGSAGGRGMMNNIDFLVSQLPPQTQTIGAVLDSPYYIDITPYDPTFEGLQYQTQEIYNRYNVSAVIPKECSDMYPGEEWKCTYGQYRIPFVKTSYLLFASQYDSYQLSNNIGREPTVVEGGELSYATDEMNQYAMSFASTTHTLLTDIYQSRNADLPLNDVSLVSANAADKVLIHSWSCYNHMVTLSSKYYSLRSLDVTQSEAVNTLLDQSMSHAKSSDNNGTKTWFWIEDCTTVICGDNCF